MQHGHLFDDRHAQTGAATRRACAIAGDERLKQRIGQLVRDTDAVIRDGQPHTIALHGKGKIQGSTRRVILQGIAQQVVKQAAQQSGELMDQMLG